MQKKRKREKKNPYARYKIHYQKIVVTEKKEREYMCECLVIIKRQIPLEEP